MKPNLLSHKVLQMNLKRPIESISAKRILFNISNNGPLSVLAVNQFPRLAIQGIEFQNNESKADPSLQVELLDGRILDIPVDDLDTSYRLFEKMINSINSSK